VKFRERFLYFIQGRYGFDLFGSCLLVTYCILGVIRVFIPNRTASLIIYALMLIIMVYTVFRILSKNIYARQKENAIFQRLFDSVKKELILTKDRFHDRKTKCYRKCPHCKNVLRLPKKKGKHQVCCPHCQTTFDVRVL